MRIDETILECVCFVGYWDFDHQLRVGGTVFFVYHDDVRLAVTAKHVINKIREISPDGPVVLWMNGQHDPITVETDIALWKSHATDEVVDVAVLVQPMPSEGFQHRSVPLEWFVTDEYLRRFDVGVGDDLYFPGLFSLHKGRTKLRPILRQGTIAAMVGDPVNTGLGPSDAYLGELRSIGGLSGSPVFLHFPFDRSAPKMTDEAIKDFIELTRTDTLLGLLHGHFPSKGDAMGNPEALNTGIGVIIPVQQIREVIEQEGVQTMVKERKDDKDKELTSAVADFDDVAVDEDAISPTGDLMRKLLQVPKDETTE